MGDPDKPSEWNPLLKSSKLSVVQDFHSKRAVAHAGFFVASLFGLFGMLSFMENCIEKASFSWNLVFDSNFLRWILLSVTYWLVWFIGLYSFSNFSFYSTFAQHAEYHYAGEEEKAIWEDIRKKGYESSLARAFSEYKRGERLKYFKEKNRFILAVAHMVIGVFLFVSLLLSKL